MPVSILGTFAGMYLLGFNPAQRFLILDGEAGRGKTQFANVMQGIVGMTNVTQLRTKHLAERFELFRYLKKTLLVGVDVEADFLSLFEGFTRIHYAQIFAIFVDHAHLGRLNELIVARAGHCRRRQRAARGGRWYSAIS